MSFRGRYPTKFRRAGNFRGHERPAFRERSRPSKRKYMEDIDSLEFEQIREHGPIRGRGRPGERRERDYYSDRGRGRPFKKHISARGLRLPRSRGRFFRGRPGNLKRGRGRRFDSPRDFDRERSYERHGSPGDFPEENEFVEDERFFDRRANDSDEWYAEEGDDYFNNGEDNIPFERRLRSPLTIHRRFDNEEFDGSPERPRERSRSHSRGHLRRSPSLERHFSDERAHSFERHRSPVERRESFDRMRESVELRRSLSIERRDNFTGYRRSHSIDKMDRFVEHYRSVSPEGRIIREERKRLIDNRHSIERSLSPPRAYRSRERSFRGSEHEQTVTESSRRSIERQIAYEKKRLQQILEHEKKIHEKRSESSIERFLDDCKRSFENNTKSRSISRSNSFEEREYRHRRNERSFERSLSPLDQSRSFKGLENITIERGRSLERTDSLSRRPSKYQRSDEFSPEIEKSSFWEADFRKTHESNSDSRRRSRSPERYRRNLPSRNLSREVSFDKLSHNSPSRAFRERSGQRERPFLEVRKGSFLGETEGHFLGEEERFFLENRKLDSREDSSSHIQNPYAPEHSFDKRSPTSSQAKSFNKRRNFLGAVDGPFSENRSISKDNKKNDNHHKKQHNMSPTSQGGGLNENEKSTSRAEASTGLQYGSFDRECSKTKSTKECLELSPVSQSESFEKGNFSDYHEAHADSRMKLSPISQTGSFEKKEFSQGNKSDQKMSPISKTESFEKKESNDKSVENNPWVTKRPSSTDSMQQFLAELEDDDRSRSSNEKFHGSSNSYNNQFQETDTQYIPNKRDGRLMESSNNPDGSCRNDTFSNKKRKRQKKTDKAENTPQMSSYYNFNFQYDSVLNKKPDKPFDENTKQDKLFNAYEKSFLNQTCDAYNEENFQGRYEQSNKIKRNSSTLSKPDTKISFSQKTPIPPLPINNIPQLITPTVLHPAQQTLSRPPCYQRYYNNYREMPPNLKPDDQYLRNQVPHSTNPLFSGSNMKSEVAPFFPNQATRPVYPLQRMPSTLPTIPTMPYQQNSLLPSQNPQLFPPPKEFIENPFGNPMFSRRVEKVSENQPDNWKSQSTQFHTNPGESKQSININQFHQNTLNNNPRTFLNQSFQNEHFSTNKTISQTVNQQFNVTPKQAYHISNLQNSEELSQNAHMPYQSRETQDQPWPAASGSIQQVSKNIPLGVHSKKKIPTQHNVKEVIVISDDEGHNTKYDDNSDNDLVFMSNGIVIPTVETANKYKNCPPSYDVLGKILRGFVIYFGVKENSVLQKDPIEVLQESFTSSEGFEKLDIEEKNEFKPSEHKQICELRWQGLLLSRGEGESKEEARQLAGISLINALAKTCYTIQTKYGYYNNGRYPKFMLKHPEKPGYYKMVKRDEIIKSVTETVKQLRAQGLAARGVDATHINAVISFMDEFFQDQETHSELIFGPSSGMEYTLGELQTIARHATNNGLQYRWFSGTKKVKVLGKFVCVSRYFSPQALKRYLLSEMGDTVRYRLFPPQGPKIDLLTTSNFYSPNMIKTILPMIGSDGNLKTDFDDSMEDLSRDDPMTSQGPNQSFPDMNQSNQLGSRWHHVGVDQGPSNVLSHQSSDQYPSPSYSLQNQGFDKSFKGPPQEVSNPFSQEGYKRNDPFQSGQGGKRGFFL